MNKKLFLPLLISISSALFPMIALDRKSFKAPRHLKNIIVLHKEEQLYIKDGNKKPVLVGIFDKNFKKNIALRIKDVQIGKSFLFVDEINGQYRIELKEKLKGSGPIGVAIGTALGYGLVHGITQGVVWTLSSFTGPLTPVVGSGVGAVTYAYSQPVAVKSALCLGTLFGIIFPF